MQSLKGLWPILALYKASLPHHEVPTVPARSSDSLVWYGKQPKDSMPLVTQVKSAYPGRAQRG